jgi:GNAT superfamily N-acetyltransferase
MPQPATDMHQDWLQTPLLREAGNDRFVAKRAERSEHEQFFDLIDLAFGEKRPRAEFDWMYRRNPVGHARTWLIFDRASGRLVSGESSFPWAISKGHQPLRGELVGDSVTHPDWRGQGLGAIRLAARETHPWRARSMILGAPNLKSRNLIYKLKKNDALMGPFAAGAMILDAAPHLQRLGWPAAVAKTTAVPANAVLAAWRDLSFRRGGRWPIEEVSRFDSGFDPLTESCMAWPGFWCPHNADFLNWRFLDHPSGSHVALAILDEDRPVGYCVVEVRGAVATLMDFAAPPRSGRLPGSLLGRAVEVARAAGCKRLEFYSPSAWRHWPLFRRAGFLPAPKEHWILARGYGMPEAFELRNWQLLPGDRA